MISLIFNGKPTIFFANPDGKIQQKDRKVSKFNRVAKLAKNWSIFYERMKSDLINNNSQEAYCCLLMASAGLRIGNEESASGYMSKIKGHEGELVKTYGATTLLKSHISFDNDRMILDFVGKKVVEHQIIVTDHLLVEYGKKFYNESKNGRWLNIVDNDVKRYLSKRIDSRLTIKDFRTFAANCIVYQIYNEFYASKEFPSKKYDLTREVKDIISKTADFLGNTPGICKSAYISPLFIEFVLNTRGMFVKQYEEERLQKKLAKEEAWKNMNEERRLQGLKIKYKRRRKRKLGRNFVENVEIT